MSSLDLTAERRHQLAALLDDDGASLRAEFPQIADYLATSAQLPAGDDPQREGVFDLALLHHMTGSDSPNPYWSIARFAVTSEGESRRADGGSPKGSARLGLAQTLLQAAYAYAIPSPETLHWIASVVEGRSVIEVGAGRGYWAHQLSLEGVGVSAYDLDPPSEQGRNTWFPSMKGTPDLWHPVGSLRDLAVADRPLRHSTDAGGHVLFLCWPPAWGHPMAHNALRAYERRGGDRLLYIGEHGGRCADEAFFNRLSANWRLVDQDASYVRWWNLKDVAQCWVRR